MHALKGLMILSLSINPWRMPSSSAYFTSVIGRTVREALADQYAKRISESSSSAGAGPAGG